ncbi:HAD-IIB family hydrolase [Desulfacinum infernum]
MRPLESLARQDVQNLWGVLFDIDDTFTTRGRIPACAYSALWSLKESGLKLVPITGRPAGWCDHIARMWPVDAVVGENGAFYFFYDAEAGKLRKRYLADEAERRENRRRLQAVWEEIRARVPGVALASDQHYREADLAVDYCEDVSHAGWEAVEEIVRIFETHGAHCKVSSIHVNGWFGDYDKRGTTQLLARELFGIPEETIRRRAVFCGDSPNDEPMFAAFDLSVGVANITRFASRMEHLPAYVTPSTGGEGFAELARKILSLLSC